MAVVNSRLVLTTMLLLAISALPVITGAGVARANRATLMDDEDMAAELANGDVQFKITLSVDLFCSDEWFNDGTRQTFIRIIRSSLISYLNTRCTCGFNTEDLSNEQITCESSTYHYSAHLLTSMVGHTHYVPSEILNDISEWSANRPKIALDSSLFGGPSVLNMSFVVEGSEVFFSSSSGDGISGDGGEVNIIDPPEPETSGDDVTIISPDDDSTGPGTTAVVVDDQEQGSSGRQNVMSAFIVGVVLTLGLLLAV